MKFSLKFSHSDLSRLAISSHCFLIPWSKGYFQRKGKWKLLKPHFYAKVIKQTQYPISGRTENFRNSIRELKNACVKVPMMFLIQFASFTLMEVKSCSCSKFNLFTEKRNTSFGSIKTHRLTHAHIYFTYVLISITSQSVQITIIYRIIHVLSLQFFFFWLVVANVNSEVTGYQNWIMSMGLPQFFPL